MFNILLPKLLESADENDAAEAAPAVAESSALEKSLWDVVIFTLGGCPGAIVRSLSLSPLTLLNHLTMQIHSRTARCIHRRLADRQTLVSSWVDVHHRIFLPLLPLLLVRADSESEYRRDQPERDDDVGGPVRLDARDIRDGGARDRVWDCECFVEGVRLFLTYDFRSVLGLTGVVFYRGGMIAPLLGGILLGINIAFPVYASIVVFVVAALAVLLLKEDEGASGDRRGGPALVH
jgi:hypothetical protein